LILLGRSISRGQAAARDRVAKRAVLLQKMRMKATGIEANA
jgi:hypothetical protein